jgi:ribosomal protein L31E
MPWVGLETTIPVFERVKTFHALDREATVIGILMKLVKKHFKYQLIISIL